MNAKHRPMIALLAVSFWGCGSADNQQDMLSEQSQQSFTPSESASLAIFKQRILPIFQSPKPSSCIECHLSGVDLKDYIRPTQQETFALLREAGLIDQQNPDESKILRFIERSPDESDLLNEEVRQKEYDAFRAWIRSAIADPQLADSDSDTTTIGPQIPDEVIRHARRDRVLASFIDNIWTEVGRCAACHSPDQNHKQVDEHGDQISWITLENPQATLDYMVEHELIHPEQPEQSLLLLKPTMQVEHGGGQKMVVGDRSYKQFRRFIDDYSAIVKGEYNDTDQLPTPSTEVSVVSDIWLKIEGVPGDYDKMLLQVDLYRMTESGWSANRVATSDRPIFGPGRLWQHSLSLTAARDSEWAQEIHAKRLPAGRYLIKVYIDRHDKLRSDFRDELGEEALVGQVEIESEWPAGYGRMSVAQFPQ